jgi:biotin operon repressor
MENGWIKLYRCSIGSRVFNNEGLLKVWIWCLLKANHSTQWVNLKTGRGSIEVECKDGQFIFGRNSAAKELNMDGSTVWKRMQKLKNMENLTIKSNKQYSLISIMNWHTYQTIEKESNSQGDKQVTGKSQASNTNNNVKNDKNEKKEHKTFLLDSTEYQLSELLFTEILKRNPDHKKPNLQTWAKDIDKLIRIDGKYRNQIHDVIKWCQQDSFWQNNILSTKKLREKFDQLSLKKMQKPSSRGQSRTERNTAAKEEFLRRNGLLEKDITPETTLLEAE